jgi:hypothetical protein
MMQPKHKTDHGYVYTAAASLRKPRARRLYLKLDCSSLDTDIQHSFENGHTKAPWNKARISIGGGAFVPPYAIRYGFINIAVDSTLAKSIFYTITGVRSNMQSTTTSSLQLLQLEVVRAWSFGQSWVTEEFHNIATWIGRSWLCMRHTGTSYDITMIELSRTERRQIVKLIKDTGNGYDYFPVWRSLWPENTSDRRGDWSNFPLWNQPHD